jgi:hypothetical protein
MQAKVVIAAYIAFIALVSASCAQDNDTVDYAELYGEDVEEPVADDPYDELTEADLERMWGAGSEVMEENVFEEGVGGDYVETEDEEDINVTRRQFIPWGGEVPKASTTTSTTLADVCGGRNDICMVEFDANGDGRPECCGSDNSTVCAKCTGYCREVCGGRSLSVSTCFTDEASTPFCQCAKGAPTCYAPEPGQTTTTQAAREEGGSGMWVYALLFALALVLVAAAHRFAERLM